MRQSCLFPLSLLLALSLLSWQSGSANADSGDSYAELANSRQWLALLHYGTQGVIRRQSRADDLKFFLSPTGKYDPLNELTANIDAFKQPFSSDPDNHPVCRFPARFTWLRAQLPAEFPQDLTKRCLTFQTWISDIDAHTATLIFPASYINNPASTFGHTLLRLDSPSFDDTARPLSYAANYAAETQGEGALLYAFKGVFGGYYGLFSVTPYYKKIQQYSDLENRDIWEYELSLSSKEVARVVAHLWELRGVTFDYYYFDENCSFQLLALLDVARPTLHLIDQYPISVTPADTVRDVVSKEGLVRKKVFRPSAATVVRQRLQQTPQEDAEIAKALFQKTFTLEEVKSLPLTREQRVSILELAYDFVVYRELRKDKQEQSTEFKYSLLNARSEISVPSTFVHNTQPEESPDQGHPSGRVGLGAGVEFDTSYLSVHWRPVYHDLLDPAVGYDRGAAINFLETELRQYRGESIRLEEFRLLQIDSLTPREFFFSNTSWGGEIGLSRRHFESGDQHLVQRLRLQAGAAYDVRKGDPVYFLAQVAQEGSRHFDAGYAAGAGAELGAYLHIGQTTVIHPEFVTNWFVLGETFHEYEARLEASFALGVWSSLRVSAGRSWGIGAGDNAVALTWYRYFQ